MFLQPAKDTKREGYIWKLKKPLYGPNDASRKFWLRVKRILNEIGLRKLDGDEAVYYKIDEKGDLEGIVLTHVDDFDLAGKTKFVCKVNEEISQALDVS